MEKERKCIGWKATENIACKEKVNIMMCYKTATKEEESLQNLQTISSSFSSRKEPGKHRKLPFWSLQFIKHPFRKAERIPYIV